MKQSSRYCVVPLLLLASSLGCQPSSPANPEPVATEVPALDLLVIEDPGLSAAIRRQWSERGEGELQVQDITISEFRSAMSAVAADAVIYPSALLGELVEADLVVPVPAKTLRDPNLAWTDVFDLVRLREATWNREVYALPLGSPQLALFYRTDVWEKAGLTAPTTWEDYTRAVQQLREGATEDGRSGYRIAAAEPLGPNWAGRLLLARSAAYARHRNFLSALFDLETMQPLIDGPPFVKALEELVATAPSAEALNWGPQDTLEQLTSGTAAAAIGWPAPNLATDGATEPAANVSIAVVELPGGRESYDRVRSIWEPREKDAMRVPLLLGTGRLASISRRADNKQAAANLLVWITGREWSDELAPASQNVTLYRYRHLDHLQPWLNSAVLSEQVASEYARVVSESLTRSDSVISVRIAGSDEYMAALDEAVTTAVRGEQPAAEALKKAAQTWDSITDRLGRDQQKEAYRRSLGL